MIWRLKKEMSKTRNARKGDREVNGDGDGDGDRQGEYCNIRFYSLLYLDIILYVRKRHLIIHSARITTCVSTSMNICLDQY